MEAGIVSSWMYRMEAMYFTSKEHYDAARKDLAVGKQKLFKQKMILITLYFSSLDEPW